MNAPGPTPYLTRTYRCVRLACHFAWLGLGAALVYPFVKDARRRRLKQRWSRQILDILAIRLNADMAETPPGCLIVANHISWLDIFAINSVRPAAFISKSEVRQWFFVGWLAARNDTVFLRRGSRGHARTVNSEIDNRLNAGRDVAVFPEGATTDGTGLLGFHAALLQPAIETGRPILPLALSYHDAGGKRTTAASFAGDIPLLACFANILACRTLTVRIQAAPIIDTQNRTRRELSQLAHAAIEERLTSCALP
ncbi:lysophospholipid acyltransferase family protein [Propionivibrio soli]|uniref:lysophospholipid acyltransferase family protein n=1 Tax=Propionivibrio soli TaxID=2976531 RepID=UPI0021E99CD8|nr:lysophospholipid acyltransferase family protein [Propionivibrio soli]